jgi:signal transduction histidine kinase
MRAQDEERRRIARELHDSAGQYLAAVSMALEAVKSEAKNLPASLTQKLEQASGVTKACSNEIRTMSHLLHPPLLEELGLASAIRFYVEGFAARSGIQVLVEMPEELGRLGNDIEIVLFRVLQESLTNIHRHSGSKTATIHVGADSRQAWIEIQDEGKGKDDGNSASFRPGIGIMGMRERVKYLGGVLEITSNHNGTRVKAVIPLTSERMKAGSVE